MPDRGDLSDILSTLHHLFPPGRVIEVRIRGEDGISSGYFADYAAAAREMHTRDSDSRVFGIYVTLNEVNPDLLARRANRIKFRIGKNDSLSGDSDIIRRRWLPIDLDPVKPSGVSSSDAEHADALVRADSIAMFLSERGWPQPIIADSGNGAHLLYPIDLPNDDTSRDLIKSVLETLDLRFSDSRCKVDTGNFNASRIWKVYGTISRKGDHLADRPHRRSRIITAPDKPGDPISAADLTSFTSLFPTREPDYPKTHSETRGTPESGGKPIDLGSWLDQYGLSYTAKPYQGGTLFMLDACPFSDAHTDGAFAIQFPNGAIFAGCHHNSCGSGRQRWSELRARFEPKKSDTGTRLARLQSDRIRAKNEAEGRGRVTEFEQAQALAQYESADSVS